MRQLLPAAVATVCFVHTAVAEQVVNSKQALAIALEAAELTESETARLQSMESTLFRNGFTDWDFEIRDGATVYDVSVAQDGDAEVKQESDLENGAPAFWAALPAPNDVASVEDIFAQAKSELVESDASLSPRDQYIMEYEVCDVPKPGSSDVGANGCKDGDALEEWSVVLRADVKDSDKWKTFMVIFEDGAQTRIGGARVGGNW